MAEATLSGESQLAAAAPAGTCTGASIPKGAHIALITTPCAARSRRTFRQHLCQIHSARHDGICDGAIT